ARGGEDGAGRPVAVWRREDGQGVRGAGVAAVLSSRAAGPGGGSVKVDRRAHRVRIPGFTFAGVRAGFKASGPDVALIVADPPAVAAGVFTRNAAPAASVRVTKPRVARGRLSAVLVHAGNANACTGAQGVRTAEASTALAARLLGRAVGEVPESAARR